MSYTNSSINSLEQQGKFVQAERVRNKIIAARRKKNNLDGAAIASQIIEKVRSDISDVLTSNDLGTAIFYVENTAESPLQSLNQALSASIQDVLNKVNGEMR